MQGGEDVGAGVGGDVEDRVDHEGEEGEGDLAGEEPDEGHSYSRKNHLSMHCSCVLRHWAWKVVLYEPRY